MKRLDYKQFYRRNLPHVVPPDATLFVTFRLAGSIPQAVVREYRAKKEWLERELERLQAEERQSSVQDEYLDQHLDCLLAFRREWFGRFEELMHKAVTGPRWLGSEEIAAIVKESLHHLDGKAFRLNAYSIMPNHVHAVFAPFVSAANLQEGQDDENGRPIFTSQYPTLARIMQSLKGYTARSANQVLGRTGPFWEHESYDHIIRDADEYQRIVRYVLDNPVKAGLTNEWRYWKWSYKREGG